MFLIPRNSNTTGTRTFGTTSIGRRVDQDTIHEQSEIARKLSPIRKKLENIYRDTDADIKYIKRRGKEISELYPQKTNTEIEIMNTVSSLQGIKLQTVKAMLASVKDEVSLENARMDMFHKMSGGKAIGNTGGASMQSAAIIARSTQGSVRPGEITAQLPSYNENNSYINRNKEEDGYEDNSYFAVDQDTNIPVELPVGGVLPPSEITQTNTVVHESNETTYNSHESAPTAIMPTYEGDNGYIPEAKEDSNFTSILSTAKGSGESSGYLIGTDTTQVFDKLNGSISYSTAAACVQNKMNVDGVNKKMHYDAKRKVGWLRTYDANDNYVDSESLTPLSILGDVEISETGGIKYATDRFNNTYHVIDDTIERMPTVLLDELKESIRNK